MVAELLLFLSWVLGAVIDFHGGRRLNAAFRLGNAALMLYGLLTFIGARMVWEDVAPLGRTLRDQWVVFRVTWLLRARRLATPTLVSVILLLHPEAATGMELAVTFDDLPTHGPLPPQIDA